mmetsp:Transcript_24157/g.39987  ORF Transcript_24157/g.39987 Transcript_24157/m.39987 type:complete len:186 (-) Transcript_24157:762-1319(-)
MKVLNDCFKGTPFKFTVVQTKYIVKETYYQSLDGNQEAIGKEYRQGDISTLNVYWGGQEEGSFAFSPQATGVVPIDGAFISLSTVPGSSAPLNMGITLVHGVGHWLGLDHTFQVNSATEDPCNPANKNDFVDDTPQQSSATPFICPLRRNSCPNLPGDDPVRAFIIAAQNFVNLMNIVTRRTLIL